MDNVIHSFHFKGKKNYSIYLPDPITNMTLLDLKRIKNVKVASYSAPPVWYHERSL